MTTTRYYKSTDAGAPTLTGQAGSYNALIKSLLVGTSGVAYGTGPDEKEAAGWSVEHENLGANKLVLRNSAAAGGSGCLMRMLDDASFTTFGARVVAISMYSSMSDIDTGSDQTPPSSFDSGVVHLIKSSTANSTARPWIAWADERTLYINLQPNVASMGNTSFRHNTLAWFGDYESFVPGDDAFGCSARGVASTDGNNNHSSGLLFNHTSLTFTAPDAGQPRIWLSRSLSLASPAVNARVFCCGVNASSQQSVVGSSDHAANPGTGSGEEFWIPSLLVHDGAVRGRLRGVYLPLNRVVAGVPGDLRSGMAGLPSGSVLALAIANSASSTNVTVQGGLGIETALEW